MAPNMVEPKDPIVAALKKDVLDTVAPNICHGTVRLDPSEGALFYKDGNSESRYLDFTSGALKDEDIQRLVEASERATFGRNNEDVLDESYRKAWKMDISQFASQFDVSKTGILDIVHDQLLHYSKSTKNLEAHLYKLNVYGPGSFFKPHVDTPRSDKLFATLVVVLPTVHAGGNLLLGENGALLNFDSAKQVYDPEAKAPRVAFVAFYSDIEHQVLPVESGYRVTLTYNLHFSEFDGPLMLKSLSSASFTTVLKSFATAIASPSILPKGGALGFGLLYRYPIDPKNTNLREFTGALKGNDALLRAVCKVLGLEPSVKILYSGPSGDKFLSDEVTDGEDISDLYGDGVPLKKKMRDAGGKLVVGYGDSASSSFKLPVVWVTQPSKMVTTDIAYMAYGNEASLAFMYGDLVLVATFPPYRQRVQHLKENFPQVLPKKILEDIEEVLKDFPGEDEEEEEEDSDEDYDGYY
ncbi:hypothetical protein FA13DRAFT_1773730 [Coprinellus micaceus]|uniref:Fe2OG dioxygenase domain-containing protein n=1 Tax=Coprinellus micaceus TaxID=71717 RepID=A0A4Y7TFT4_COPMI|nr:hypothetical protein FA13DRAFT_1773730 [Coprinellus micaceus]